MKKLSYRINKGRELITRLTHFIPQEMLYSIHQGDAARKSSAAERHPGQKSKSLISMIQLAEPKQKRRWLEKLSLVKMHPSQSLGKLIYHYLIWFRSLVCKPIRGQKYMTLVNFVSLTNDSAVNLLFQNSML